MALTLKNVLTKNSLYNLYITKQLSSFKIANIFNCTYITVLKYLKKYNIPIRKRQSKHQQRLLVCLLHLFNGEL